MVNGHLSISLPLDFLNGLRMHAFIEENVYARIAAAKVELSGSQTDFDVTSKQQLPSLRPLSSRR